MTNASPTAASAAAIAMEKMATITPVGGCGCGAKRQNAMKFRFAAASIISMPMRMKIACRRLSAASKSDAKQRCGDDEKQLKRWRHRFSSITRIKPTDQRSSEEQSDALQRPDVIGHQRFADSFDGERSSLWRRRWRATAFAESPKQPGKHSKRDNNAAPIEHRGVPSIAAGEQNRENDQHRDCADINEYLDQVRQTPRRAERRTPRAQPTPTTRQRRRA